MSSSSAPTKAEMFRRDLAALLNRHSMENGSDTPDYLLADYLIECLRSLDAAIQARERWYGRTKGLLTTGLPSDAASHASPTEGK